LIRLLARIVRWLRPKRSPEEIQAAEAARAELTQQKLDTRMPSNERDWRV
jgi:hypothetical protein